MYTPHTHNDTTIYGWCIGLNWRACLLIGVCRESGQSASSRDFCKQIVQLTPFHFPHGLMAIWHGSTGKAELRSEVQVSAAAANLRASSESRWSYWYMKSDPPDHFAWYMLVCPQFIVTSYVGTLLCVVVVCSTTVWVRGVHRWSLQKSDKKGLTFQKCITVFDREKKQDF